MVCVARGTLHLQSGGILPVQHIMDGRVLSAFRLSAGDTVQLAIDKLEYRWNERSNEAIPKTAVVTKVRSSVSERCASS